MNMKRTASSTHDERINAHNAMGPNRMAKSTHAETVSLSKWFIISIRPKEKRKKKLFVVEHKRVIWSRNLPQHNITECIAENRKRFVYSVAAINQTERKLQAQL